MPVFGQEPPTIARSACSNLDTFDQSDLGPLSRSRPGQEVRCGYASYAPSDHDDVVRRCVDHGAEQSNVGNGVKCKKRYKQMSVVGQPPKEDEVTWGLGMTSTFATSSVHSVATWQPRSYEMSGESTSWRV